VLELPEAEEVSASSFVVCGGLSLPTDFASSTRSSFVAVERVDGSETEGTGLLATSIMFLVVLPLPAETGDTTPTRGGENESASSSVDGIVDAAFPADCWAKIPRSENKMNSHTNEARFPDLT